MSNRLLRRAGLTLAVLAASLAISVPVSAAPGNNGTVKIDGDPFSDLRNNEPHVGCTFEVEFFGFDTGTELTALVKFALQAPSGSETILINQEVTLVNGKGARTFTLDFSDNAIAHEKQGYHVKLTVNAPYSRGADVKHKVFWVTGCDDDPCEYPPTEPPNQTET